jgi:RNA polymerase sigma-70 factor (ECF subfamily)
MRTFATLLLGAGDSSSLEGAVLQDTKPFESRALADFLATVERKGFRIAQIALRHDQDALDAVQDAMLKLVRSYARRPADEWRPLFYRILENCIRDMQRRRRTRGRVIAWWPWHAGDSEERDETDLLEQAPDPGPTPASQAQTDETLQALERAVAQLPARQQQAFLLRSVEGMDVAATARAMGCSEGSVKTHYFRALQALRAQLGEFAP